MKGSLTWRDAGDPGDSGKLVRELKGANESLEKRVEERTAELARKTREVLDEPS